MSDLTLTAKKPESLGIVVSIIIFLAVTILFQYFNFTADSNSLIQGPGPEDVKELQERGVLVNRLANLEKVVEVYKEIDTFGLHDQDVFKDVKGRIQEHCSSRARTWIVELIYTRFQTPWTAIALLFCRLFSQ